MRNIQAHHHSHFSFQASNQQIHTSMVNSAFLTTIAFTVNYIIGSGFLTIPWAFEKVGVLLGSMILGIFSLFSIISTYFLLETIERAQICEKHNVELTDRQILSSTIGNHSSSDSDQMHADELKVDDEFDALLYNYYTKTEVTRKREITELCRNFLGRRMANLYIVVVLIFIYGILWAYSSVFANSFRAFYNLGPYSYEIYLLIFLCFAVPMSLMELSEQLYIQVLLSLFRFVMFLILIISVIVAHFFHRDDFQIGPVDNNGAELSKIHFSKIQYLIPVAAFSFLFHHAIPSLTQAASNKAHLNTLFTTSILLCAVSYILLGFVLAWYFGDQIRSSCNLNWEKYHLNGFSSTFSLLIRAFVLLFPAFDVASAFPLNALSLGNSLMSAYYGDRIGENMNSRLIISIFRLLAAVPPIIGSTFMGDLGHITDYTGIPGLLIMFIFPPLLAWQSSKKLSNLGLSPRSIHSNVVTGPFFQVLLFCTGIVLVFYVSFTLLI